MTRVKPNSAKVLIGKYILKCIEGSYQSKFTYKELAKAGNLRKPGMVRRIIESNFINFFKDNTDDEGKKLKGSVALNLEHFTGGRSEFISVF